MPRDTRSLMIRAIPRLEKRDEKAKKLEAKLAKVGVTLWNKGPRGLRKIGVKLDPSDHEELDRRGLFKGAHAALGDKEFVRFVRRLKEVLAKKAAKREEGGDSGREQRKSSARRERKRSSRSKPEPEPQAVVPEHIPDSEARELTMSGPELQISGEGLALPEDSGELALPGSGEGLMMPGSDEGLALPADLEDDEEGGELGDFDLDTLEIDVGAPAAEEKPLSIRFGDDEGGGAKDEDDSDPARAAERALKRYGRSGDTEELNQAKKLFKTAIKSAEGPVAQGAARGGLARCYFLSGDLDKARDMAKKALKAFPHDVSANAVACQVEWEGEPERERLKAQLARADHALSGGDHAEVKAAAKAISKALPKEPYAGLLMLAITADTGSGDMGESVAKAWKHYPPSATYADLLLGPALEKQISVGITSWLKDLSEGDDSADFWGKTVKDVESKKNVYAGGIQILLGVTRAVLAARKLKAPQKQQYASWAAHGLYFSQHYDAGKEAFAGAIKFDREGDLIGELRKMDTQCGVMKRAFDRPGVKAQRGSFDGVGLVRYREALAARLRLVLEGLEGDRAKLDAKEAQIVDAILADPARKKAIQKAAKKAGNDDPFAPLDALTAEGASLAAAEPPKKAKKGGLFGRMKDAAAGAIDKAKAAAQGAVNASKQKEARRALGESLRDDRPDKGWGDKPLDSFLDKAALIEPRLNYLDNLADELRSAAGKAAG
jgi:tetratricopeptide (TPR) repeat protein